MEVVYKVASIFKKTQLKLQYLLGNMNKEQYKANKKKLNREAEKNRNLRTSKKYQQGIDCQNSNHFDIIAYNNKHGYKEFVKKSEAHYNNKCECKVFAFYLPQFYEFEENNAWHGQGFTEWTNVTKAISQFTNHYQPKLPVDIGFYKLDNADTIKKQAALAKQYGISAFCFHYYWFSGKRLMEKPLDLFLNNEDIEFPFIISWANEKWTKRWDGGQNEILQDLVLQEDDPEKFFYDILPVLRDQRYVKIKNKPILMVYKSSYFSKEATLAFTNTLRALAKREGFDDLHLITSVFAFEATSPNELGFDALVEFPPHGIQNKLDSVKDMYINPLFEGRIFSMNNFIKKKRYIYSKPYRVYKSVFPEWDNSARRAYLGCSVFLMNPELYKEWLMGCIEWTKSNNPTEEQIVFVNAWNEWSEGAMLEPCNKYGYAYLKKTKEALEESC